MLLLLFYSALIALASLGGGWFPTVLRLGHVRLQLFICFVAGLMLGVGLFHMLPHAALETASLDQAVNWLMIGLIAMFLLMRAFRFHQHESADLTAGGVSEHKCLHDHDHEHDDPGPHVDRWNWVGVALGMSLHSIIDGIALGASVGAGSAYAGAGGAFVGLATFLAILLHKPLDAMSITLLMAAGQWSVRPMQLVNLLYALLCPASALLFFLGSGHANHTLVGCALAFSAGVFLCISLSDLLPEVQFHSHDRVKLSVVLLLGVLASKAIVFLEPAHLHDHPVVRPQSVEAENHDDE